MTYAELVNDIHDIRQQYLERNAMIDCVANKIVDYVIANDMHIKDFDFKNFFLVIETL